MHLALQNIRHMPHAFRAVASGERITAVVDDQGASPLFACLHTRTLSRHHAYPRKQDGENMAAVAHGAPRVEYRP